MEIIEVKPIIKWAGGKTQLLKDLLPLVPTLKKKNKYIEPFIGGGALFFALQPKHAIISDSNPELINMYIQVASNVENVIALLKEYKNTKELFYEVRSQNWEQLPPEQAAARMIYLNKTCYNGLYRVNKDGAFNVPFGDYKNPNICDEENLRAASMVLRKATILCDDYLKVLNENAEKQDFVFLDPPYIPVSKYADFKRYTKEQFRLEDHEKLSEEVKRLYELGCNVILTNSNSPLVYDLYSNFPIKAIQTKRYISKNANTRKGEDVIVNAVHGFCEKQIKKYPMTRFMGSKRKLISNIWQVTNQFKYNSVLDLFSGSGVVGYMFKAHGKQVMSNDYMAMSATFCKALIENNSVVLSEDDIKVLLEPSIVEDHFVEETFRGIYFSDTDNQFIDTIRSNIRLLNDDYKKAIAMTALIRACMKKRPRGIFTYTGERYDDGRKDLLMSFEEQFIANIHEINEAVFDNGRENKSYWHDSLTLESPQPDLVYIDPPYYTPLSDNEYVRRYHFVEGLARNWEGVEIQENTTTKKFKSYPTPFSNKDKTVDAFKELFNKYRDSILVVSYSSNCLPDKETMIELLKESKENVEVYPIEYNYTFGNKKPSEESRNKVEEYLFVAY